MAEVPLIAEPRANRGSAASRRLRVEGRVPAVVYGHSIEPISVAVDGRELRSAVSTEAGGNALFDLVIGGEHHLAIARELQRHPVRQSISHVDFQVVRRDQLVPAEIPVILIGEATLVHRADGTLEQLLQTVHIQALPGEIPVHFEIDISELEVGDSVHVSDLEFADGVHLETDPEALIVIAHPPRTATVEEGEAAGGEQAETGGSGAASNQADESSESH